MAIFGIGKKPTTVDTLKSRYIELCAKRDAVNEKVELLQPDLDAANRKVQDAQQEAARIAAAIQALRGDESWIAMKKEIGLLAKALSGK